MIPTRAPQYLGAPAAPAWLDPNKLGATKLIEVRPEYVQVIEGGETGLLGFLMETDLDKAAHYEAFVVVRGQGGPCVYSREQFWLTANLFLAASRRGFEPLEFSNILHQVLVGALIPHGSFSADDRQFLRAELKVARKKRRLQERIGFFFDLHEYAGCEMLAPGESPTRPSLQIGLKRKIVQAFVPDTKGLFHGAAGVVADIKLESAGEDFPSFMAPGGLSNKSRRLRSEGPGEPIGGNPGKNNGCGRSMRKRPVSPGARARKKSDDEPVSAVVRRHPHLDLSATQPLLAGQEFQVRVYVDESAARPGETTELVEFTAPPEVKSFPLCVWLVGTRHFEILGPDQGNITIQRDTAGSDAAEFRVKVRTNHGETLSPRLTAIFDYQGRPCGSVSVTPKFQEPAVAGTPPATPGPAMAVHLSAKPADLTVTIANPSGNGKGFSCKVETPLLPEYRCGVTQPWELPDVASDIVKTHFTSFTLPGLPPELRLANLTGAGVDLFKVAPAHFRDAFWKLIDQKIPLKSIQVVSAEAHIPWELMVPHRVEPGAGLVKRAPLGVEFAIGRWICHDFLLPAPTIPLRDSWVFAPRYDPTKRPRPLAKAPDESALVLSSYAGAEITPAIYTQLEAAMAQGGRSLLHFVCHGASPGAGAQAIVCEDLTEFSSSAVGGAQALPKAIGASHPFIFLNACEVGRTTPALIGTGGFGPAFIEVGASAVLAPLWSVKDTIAHEVAVEFYAAIKAQPTKPFAEILQAIRARAYADGGGAEDTYAAYCFYGDPLAASA